MLDAVGLDGGLDEHQTALGAGDGTADRDLVQFGIDLDDVQVLDGHLVAAHLTCADLALENTAGIGGGAHGTGVTVDRTAAVGHAAAAGIPALDSAGVTVTLARAGHVNEVAGLEGISLDDGAELQLGSVVKVELTQVLLGETPALFRWPSSGLESFASRMSS